jgi:hypothetical protein
MWRLHRNRLATLLLALAACSIVSCTAATDIGDLLSDAERYDGQEVKIRGTVRNAVRIPLVDIRLYNVADGTGEVVVLTSGPLPSRGDRVTVKGTFSTLGSVNGQSLGPHIRVEGAE